MENMKFLRAVSDGTHNFWCPACDHVHNIKINSYGNPESPTINAIISNTQEELKYEQFGRCNHLVGDSFYEMIDRLERIQRIEGGDGLDNYIARVEKKGLVYNMPKASSISLEITNWSNKIFKAGVEQGIALAKKEQSKRCTLTIENGKINYHPESEHELHGQTIDMIKI